MLEKAELITRSVGNGEIIKVQAVRFPPRSVALCSTGHALVLLHEDTKRAYVITTPGGQPSYYVDLEQYLKKDRLIHWGVSFWEYEALSVSFCPEAARLIILGEKNLLIAEVLVPNQLETTTLID